MPEVQLVAHTIRSHGVAVARLHMHDWLILVLLMAVDLILNFIEPFHRFVGEGMMVDLRYPLKGNTVPFWAVPIIGILLPFIVILIYYFIRRDVYDLHQAVLGLLFSVGVTAVITDAIKDGVGRPRPDFFWRCFPDGRAVFDPVTRKVLCTGIKSVIKEGHKSFPSGHTSCKQSDLLQERVYVASLVVMLFILPFIRFIVYIPGDWSFAGLGFLAWYLSGKIRAFDHRGHVAKLCIAFLPILLAALVGVSRVDDYWHHWQDVFAGGLLGMTIASFCYLQFFPPPYDVDGWGPHAYFQTLRESQNGIQSSTTNANSLNVLQSELTSACMRPQQGLGISEIGTGDSSPMLDALENGRRLEILN